MDFTPMNIRTLSLLGKRRVFGKCILDLAKGNNKIIALTADQGRAIGLAAFQKEFPERYFNIGISEQNAIGVAAGLANGGFIPFLSFQAVFASLRCTDQIKVNLGYMKSNVKLIGLFSGFTQCDSGPTHYAIQDIAIMRTFPNMTVMEPADAVETVKMIEASANLDNPVYIRLSGENNSPIVYKNDYKFEVGKAVNVKDGNDISIVAIGSMVAQSLKVAKKLEENGITARVINMHTVKPLDVETIKSCFDTRLIVTVEEHSIFGGLGSAIAEVLAQENNAPRQVIIGADDVYKKAGEYDYLLEQYKLSSQQIIDRILAEYQKNRGSL